MNGPLAAAALWKLAEASNDPYLNGAILSSAQKHYVLLVNSVIGSRQATALPIFADLLRMGLAMNNRDAMAGMLKLLVELHDDGVWGMC